MHPRRTRNLPQLRRPTDLGGRALWLASALLVGCGADPVGVRDVVTVTHELRAGGATRSYRLHVPPDVTGAGPAPLLLVFHGATQSAAGIELMSWLYPMAEREGLLVAYPQASGDYWNTPNSPPGYWGIPDVPFVDAILDDVSASHDVDRSRVYVAGFSNGAIFAQLYACLRGAKVGGLGVVGSGVSAELSASCPWTRRIPTVVFFGDQDPQFFWDDGLAAGTGMLGGGGSAAWLARTNGCDPSPAVDTLADAQADGTTVQRWRYTGCSDGADVDFYRIVGGGHTWPGSPLNLDASFGRKTRDVSASEVLVDFFVGRVASEAPR